MEIKNDNTILGMVFGDFFGGMFGRLGRQFAVLCLL